MLSGGMLELRSAPPNTGYSHVICGMLSIWTLQIYTYPCHVSWLSLVWTHLHPKENTHATSVVFLYLFTCGLSFNCDTDADTLTTRFWIGIAPVFYIRNNRTRHALYVITPGMSLNSLYYLGAICIDVLWQYMQCAPSLILISTAKVFASMH